MKQISIREEFKKKLKFDHTDWDENCAYNCPCDECVDQIIQIFKACLPKDVTKYCIWEHDKEGFESDTCGSCRSLKACLKDIEQKLKRV